MVLDLKNKKISAFTDLFSNIENKSLKKLMLQGAVDQYKYLRDTKNELSLKNDELRKNIDALESKVASSRDLLKLKDRIELELNRFGDLGSRKDLEPIVQKMKVQRLDNVYKVLKSLRNITAKLITQNNNPISGENLGGVKARLLLFTSFLVITLSVGLLALNSNITFFTFGLFVAFVNVVFFFLINYLQEVHIDTDIFSINYSDPSGNYYQKFVENINRKENAFFVNAAWINALQREKNKVMEVIQSRLGGRSFLDIDAEKKKYESEINSNQNQIDTILDHILSAEDYLNIRRELDLISSESNESIERPKVDIIGISNLEEKLKGTIMNYLNFLKNNEIIIEFQVS